MQMHRSSISRIFMRAVMATFAVAFIGAIQVSALAAEKTVVRIAWSGDPTTMDPVSWGTYPDQYIMDNVYPRLAKPAPGREWTFELDAAESVDLSDPLAIKFTLKKGLMWTQGYGELTAEDVKYTYERLASGETAAPGFEALDNVEITGTHSGIIHMKYPAATLWMQGFTFTIGGIINKKFTEESGGKVPANSRVTLGPYQIKEHLRGERLVLERDPNWKGETGDFDEIVLLPIEDENAALAAFAAGELDWVLLSFQNALAAQKNGIENGVIDMRKTIDFVWLGMNVESPNLTDIRVRHAIQKAIDVRQVVDAVWGDAIPPATGLAAPGMVGYRDVEPPARDLEGARALVAETGADSMTFNLNLPNYDTTMVAAQVIQAQLAEAGINVELLAKDDATFYDLSTATPEDRELMLQWWTGNPSAIYGLSYQTTAEKGAWNWQNYQTPEYDEILDAAGKETDDEKRGAMFVQMQEMLEDAGAFVYVANPPLGYLYRNTRDPGMLADGRPVFHAFKSKPSS